VTRAGLTAGVAVGAALFHAAPGVSWLPRVRRHLPRLDGQGRAGSVALTFDDGPDPESTPALLDLLADLDVRATFFVLGQMVQAAPDLARRLVADGHEVALHGWHHRNSLLVSGRGLQASLAQALDLLADTTGVRPRWYRPPYGVMTAGTVRSARNLGLDTVLWGAWGRDWTQTATPASVLRRLAPDLSGGVTVLLHDSDSTSEPGSWRSTLGAVRPLVSELRDRGLGVGPLRDHRVSRHRVS